MYIYVDIENIQLCLYIYMLCFCHYIRTIYDCLNQTGEKKVGGFGFVGQGLTTRTSPVVNWLSRICDYLHSDTMSRIILVQQLSVKVEICGMDSVLASRQSTWLAYTSFRGNLTPENKKETDYGRSIQMHNRAFFGRIGFY